ncbi:dUTP diphosphatase [Planktothricoides sp. FACHB-1370]|uniref:Deoxyuridine 5'-triphosphate nucleotidohydrolase n=2 Tax=Planktothricoides raciborskii TaxID=132608 RepID=A0AAU8JL23_9CYAN|nr:deoxyuridine 5'-triphosphate nucleotidohydrolase [Planktothricoides sp. SR001]MBD2546087.1 dUTP diphosphatase [Planktothricoides raciborskii FACHB-1370]MBD2583750.1 dUTP diphosphatase [Planktothricoides raciborskii FACHB-1261]
MVKINMKIHLLYADAQVPTYAHDTDSGMDLLAYEDILIPAGEWRLVGTGIAIELPHLTEAQVRPRSGLAAKHGITVLNTPGTIDEGYRGEIKVILINHSPQDFQVEKGMRIAQMVIAPVFRPKVEVCRGEISATTRGAKGFGSTGI